MRRAISALLLTSILLSAIIPVFAQLKAVRLPQSRSLPSGVEKSEAPSVKPPISEPKSSRFQSVEAYSDGQGVWLRWKMDVETQNFGFNVYAVDGRGRRRLNNSPIPGAAIKVTGQPLFGQEYQFLAAGKEADSQFVIETLPLSGTKASSEIFTAKSVSDLNMLDGFSMNSLVPKNKSATGNIVTNFPVPDSDLQAQASQSMLAPDPVMQKWVAAQPGVKLGVKTAGIYRVTKAQLQSAGFDVSSDPSTWQLFVDGREQAINVAPNGDYIEFYGTGIDRVESDTRIYYLLAGPAAGKRMAVKVAGPSMSPVASRSYSQTFVKKERTIYIDTIFNGDEENYYGSIIYATPYTLNFNLSGIDRTVADCTMSVKLQGFSFTTHPISLTLNGHALAPMTGNGNVAYSADYTVPIAYLNEGANALAMVSTGGSSDFSLFDQIDITFQRSYVAQQNSLSFFTQNYRAAVLSGFTSPNVRVFDTTYDGSPVQITGLSFQNSGGSYGTRVPANRGKILYAVEDSAILGPASIEKNNTSTLSTVNHNANLVIISYKNWMAQADTWANYRRGQGFSVEVVDVADVYDEFNYGVLSADAIKSFLQYAKNNWQTPPQYVLLLGDATYDPRNYEGFASQGALDYIPAKIVTTLFSETPSDDALADFDNDGLAEMAVGRIPARDAQTVTNALNKVTNFEQPVNQTLSRGSLFVYDVADYDFQGLSDRLMARLPAGSPTTKVGKTDPNAQQSLVNSINTGNYVVNYSGHGSIGVWSNPGFFGSANVSNCTGQPTCVNNPSHESIFLTLTCLNGYFLTPTADGLSERLLKAANGGAVIVWSSTGETTPDVQEEMGTQFYSQLGSSSTTMTRMGDFMLDAKSHVIGGPDVRLSFTLLGDPMLKIRQ